MVELRDRMVEAQIVSRGVRQPAVLSAMFDVNDAIEANFTTRVKMGQSSNVYAVALMNDGKTLFTHKEVKVTLGGCGG